MHEPNVDALWDSVVSGDSAGGETQGDAGGTPTPETQAAAPAAAATEKDVLDDDAIWERIQSHPRLTSALTQYTEQVATAHDQQWLEHVGKLGLSEELVKRNEALAKGDKYWEKAVAAGEQAQALHQKAVETQDPRIEKLAKQVEGVSRYLAAQAEAAAKQAKKAGEDAVMNDVNKALATIKGPTTKDPDFRKHATDYILKRARADLSTGKGVKDFAVYANEYPQYVQRVFVGNQGTQYKTVPATTVVPGETPLQRRQRIEKELTSRLFDS